MPMLHLENVNWLAVLVAALATFFLGAVWYTALLGKAWQRANGYTDDKVKELQKARPLQVFLGMMAGSYVILAIGVALLCAWLGVVGWKHGAHLGLLLWFAVALPIGLTHYIANDRRFAVYLIDLSYQLTFLVMTGIIIGAWR